MAYSAELNAFQTLFAAKFNFAWRKQSMNSMRNVKWQEGVEAQTVYYYYDHAAARTAKPCLLLSVPATLTGNERVDAIDLGTGARCSVFVAQMKNAEDVLEAQIMDDAIEAVEIRTRYTDLDMIDILQMVETISSEKEVKKSAKKGVPAAAPAPDPNATPFDEIPAGNVPPEVPFEDPGPEVPFADPDAIPFEATEGTGDGNPFAEGPGLVSLAETTGAPAADPQVIDDQPSLAEQALAAQPSMEPKSETPAKKEKGKAKKEKPEQLPCTKFSGASIQQLMEEIPVRLAAANRLIQNAATAKDGENPWQMLRSALFELDEAGTEVARIIARGDQDGQARYNPMVAIPATNIAMGLRQVARNLENGFEKPKTWDEAVKTAKPLVKGMEGMKITIHQQGIADVVKTPGPRLKTKDGEALENTGA